MSSLYLVIAFIVFSCNAFQFQNHHTKFTSTTIPKQSTSRCMSSNDYDSQESSSTSQLQTKTQHPDVICWTKTLQESPNSFVHPSIELTLRPPSEGGTGLIATAAIERNTKVLSLDVDEVPVIDAESFFRRYDEYSGKDDEDDEVLKMLANLWRGGSDAYDSLDKATLKRDRKMMMNSRGTKDDVMTGILAHLTLTRYRDLSPHCNNNRPNEGSFILKESRRLGHFLDSMPLFPNLNYSGRHDDGLAQHPFPSHFVYWKETEQSKLLKWTLAGSFGVKELRVPRDCIRMWYDVFLKEHPGLVLTDVINAVESAFATSVSRAFGKFPNDFDLDGEGEQAQQFQVLVPLVDKMNHAFDRKDVNLVYQSPIFKQEDERKCRAKGERVTFDLLTVQDVQAGDELFTSYGEEKKDFIFACNYGFVNTSPERTACSGIPILPRFLELDPDNNSDAKLDLREMKQWNGITKAIDAAVNAVRRDKDSEFPYLIIPISPLESSVPRYRPTCQIETKLGSGREALYHQKATIQSILPAFRAAANALAQLKYNYQNGVNAPVKLKNMVLAAALKDSSTDWDMEALKLMHEGITERIQCLSDVGAESEAWLKRVGVHSIEEREIRANMARDIRASEIEVLEALDAVVLEWQQGAVGY